ncbi:unnamed protein product [Leptidea sinapis]|uniref:Uncharacterized protein n=1 Tax=Leptidea sinapis TaxID=189913 RepID=A0A5E4Q7Q7_9NEOP|nr:unnamed protein product [Leptidea sinapis]
MASCCACTSGGPSRGTAQSSLPLICLVPRDDSGRQTTSRQPSAPSTSAQSDFQLLDEDYIKKHFKLPQRALYLDPFSRTRRQTTRRGRKMVMMMKKSFIYYNCQTGNSSGIHARRRKKVQKAVN